MRLLLLLALSGFALFAHAEKPTYPAPPDLLGKSVDGAAVRLSDLRGKVVVITFWASFCEPCRKELPILANLQKVAGPERLRVVAINSYDEPQVIAKIAKALPEPAPMLVRDSNGRIARASGVRLLPHLVLVGADGQVAHTHDGYGEAMLDSILDEINALLEAQQRGAPGAAVP